jgi:FeS assembly protein IscX
MPKLRWSDADEIGFALSAAHPNVDPLTVRFTDLHRFVTQLPEFADDPATSNERLLEAIQMAWLAYFQEDRDAG